MMHNPSQALDGSPERLPTPALLALATVGFVANMTETVPAGLLPHIARGLDTTQAVAGQMVTAYAVGSTVAAIPLMALTLAWRRRAALLLAVLGLFVANGVTAASTDIGLTMVARVVGGFSSGLAWGLVASYARLLAPARLQGRALALALAGTPVALSVGVPAGTFFGDLVGWRTTFALMSTSSLALCGWILLGVPDFPGRSGGLGPALRAASRARALHVVLFVVFAWMLAHNVLYTFVAPLAARAGLGSEVGTILLAFGFAALAGIALAGRIVDRLLYPAAVASMALFAAVAALLAVAGQAPSAVLVGAVLWGLSFGGASTFLNTAAAESAREGADLALASVTTIWNMAIAAGGAVGGALLARTGAGALPWAALACLIPPLLVATLPLGRASLAAPGRP